MNTEEFITKAKSIHGDKYDYSSVFYVNKRTKVEIGCKEHGMFMQTSSNHFIGCGCPKCNIFKKPTQDEFLEKSKIIHNNKYDYIFVEYKTSKIKVKIICKYHGIFEQAPKEHVRGAGCQKCSGLDRLNNVSFIEKSKLIHNNLYDYDMVDVINNSSKIKIKCLKHGIFEQTPNSHLRGVGCPICKNSKGELKINKILSENNINYKTQYTFPDLKYKRKLFFDFGVLNEENNLKYLIEYQGKQHYIRYDKFHKTEQKFLDAQLRDKLKIDYCDENNIKLFTIKYNEIVEDKMNLILNVD